MPDNQSVTELFRFLVVRDRPITTPDERDTVEAGDITSVRSPVRQQLDATEGDAHAQREIAREHVRSNVEVYSAVKDTMTRVYRALWKQDEVTARELEAAARRMVDNAEPEEGLRQIAHTLEDMVLAWSIAPSRSRTELDEAIRLLRFWYLVVSRKAARLLPDRLENAMNRVVISLPRSVRASVVANDAREDWKTEPPLPRTHREVGDDESGEENASDLRRLDTEIGEITRAITAIRTGAQSGSAIETIEEEAAPVRARKARRRWFGTSAGPGIVKRSTGSTQRFRLDALGYTDRETVAALVEEPEKKSAPELIRLLARQIASREAQVAQLRRRTWLSVGNMLVRRSGHSTARAVRDNDGGGIESNRGERNNRLEDRVRSDEVPRGPKFYYAGVADLKIVKETLIAYELADIAHIENVLAGEVKERTHRRLESTETEEIVVSETEEETERDSQSTTKNELATESSTVAKETVKVEGSLTVSGSYGPSVDFTASVSGAYALESTTSTKRAAAFAQEVVDKTVEKVRRRVLEQRRIRTLTEVEETNLHGIRNAYPGAEHVRGVYRWLNKITEAQVYNYGARHMFSFVVPEPASFYLWSLESEGAAAIEEPVAPWFTSENILHWNFQARTATFGASAVKSPPEWYHTLTKSFKSESAVSPSDDWDYEWKQHSSKWMSDTVQIPPGYQATSVRVNYTYWAYFADAYADLVWSVASLPWSATGGQSLGNYQGEITVSATVTEVMGFLVTFDMNCWLDTESAIYRQWQLETYDAIVQGYQRQLSAYEEQLAALGVQQGVAVPGRNPGTNLQIVRNELKRACLSMFFGIDLDTINAFRSTDPLSPDYWRINFDAIPALGFQIAFLERAFEWENMTYMFYPYFWGRFGEWTRRVVELGDPDPSMAAFLKAGAARVLVPARPEFAEAMLQFADRGHVESGSESLLTADDAIEAMIAEVRNRGVDSVPNAVPEGDPWEARLPTALILLQDPKQITFRDMLYGDAQGEAPVDFDYAVPSDNGNGSGATAARGSAVSSRRAPPQRKRAGREKSVEVRDMERDVDRLLSE
jgi:hypothetical protein